MNIAVDIQPLVSGSKERGMGRYTADLLKEMFWQDQENEYFLFNIYGNCVYDGMELPPNVHYQKFYTGKDNYLLRYEDRNGVLYLPYESIIRGLFETFIQKNHIDLFLITSLFDGGVMCYKKEWFTGAKVAIIAYDLIPLIFKEKYLNNTYGGIRQYYNNLECLKSADVLLAISNSVKEDLEKYLNIDPEKIVVIYSGVSGIFQRKSYPEEQQHKVFQKYGISGKFMVFPSAGDFRKNVEGTITAYSQLPRKLIDQYQLVITGGASPEYMTAVHNFAALNDVAGRVLLTGFIPDEELILLYNCAELLIFPSLYEGFGLPVVEAFACGTHVITSNNSSLGEVACDAAILVDPFEPSDIARGMAEALTKTDFKVFEDEIKRKLQLFTWENSARCVLDTIQMQVKNSLEACDGEEEGKKRIAFFSPMPPIPSGISDYSTELLDELCHYCDIDVFTDVGYTVTCELPKNVKVNEHFMFPAQAAQYDAIIYQMGNNDYHTYMLPYIRKYPGTVVLHDLNLHRYVYYIFAMRQNWEQYKEFLQYEVDDVDALIEMIQAHPEMAEHTIAEIPVNRFVTEFAQKIIVHSDYARAKLLEKNIGYRVKKINLFASRKKAVDVDAMKKKYGIQQDEIVLASFGQAAAVKRILPILQALLPIIEENPKVRYYIVGKVLDKEILEYIEETGLENNVVVTGFVDDIEIFKEYIDITDICLNLRYPYYGETSASFMRTLAAGKPSLVTDIGSFAEIPDECCIKIGYEEDSEVIEIENAIRRLIDDAALRETMGANARRFAEEKLDVRQSAEQYYHFAMEPQPAYLAEGILCDIYEHEMIPRQIEIQEESKKISATLAYLLDAETTLAGSEQYYEKAERDINTEDIMAEIYSELRKQDGFSGGDS